MVDRTADEIATVRAELGRVDNKAALLLAVVTAALAGGVTLLARGLPTVSAVLVVLALTSVTVAGWLLLSAVRPNLNGNHGLVGYAATANAGDVARMVEDTDQAETLRALSRLAVRKYRRQQRAVDLLRTSLVLAAAAVALAAIA
ncbi:Pycsar system effector family protein [Plantactinospora sp. CA-290183]|uniref:Pycsar system effector family protein n=1 Tax=Plantactinospora sp. CA-290183 TaxID=3240006 RepID=UPI003D8B4034